ISPEEKHKRAKIIDKVCKLKHKQFLESQIGKHLQVLFESSKKGNKMFGFTNNYIKVVTNYDKKLVNQIVNIEILGFFDDESMQIKIL
ncbi:MAG: tRNA (N(6)-L-threonylcarbamoyladenosine(37)-C(2))-methylthiotransferase MtaB, partial [Bacteroidales bacterium]|nr:tRNA (N(6)-L-threonylcarbamoyladenosine(37)-C(2))-methylthiotransferase MtaB [Bacteroidales bacterium]